MITDKQDTQTRANLYSAVIGFKGKDQIETEGAGAELKNDFIFELAAGLAQAWWGGAVRPEGSGGAALLTGLTAYNAYLAAKEVYSPEAASGIIDQWYERYLLSKQKFLWYEKPLNEITPFLDWQQQLAECKTPLVLHALSYLTGEEEFLQILKETYQEYTGGTVTIGDFQTVAEKISGLDLQWFFAYFFENAFHLDLEIVSCASQQMAEGYRTAVLLSGAGDRFKGQVDVEVQTETETIRYRIDLAEHGKETVIVETEEPVQVVWLDPDAWWPDLNRENNLWRNK